MSTKQTRPFTNAVIYSTLFTFSLLPFTLILSANNPPCEVSPQSLPLVSLSLSLHSSLFALHQFCSIVSVCVCALSRCARYFPFSHSHSVPCGVRALIRYCYISSRVQMLTHMSVCVCYMLRHVNILSKIKASCLLKLFADTLPISHWFFLVSSS